MPFEDHPLATAPPDDAVLWRYLSLTRFIGLLERRKLWFSRMDEFEDPMEGTFTDSELKYLERLPVVPSPRGPESIGKSYLQLIEMTRTSSYVSCWREGPYESMAMWGIYGKGDVTVAIKSNVEKLKNAFATYEREVYLSRVEYMPWADTASWPNNSIAHCFRKDESYSFETEVRAVISCVAEDPRINSARRGLELDFEPSSLIAEVVIGPREQAETVKLVETVLERHGLKVLVTASNRLKPRN
jgi:hypothetical protein